MKRPVLLFLLILLSLSLLKSQEQDSLAGAQQVHTGIYLMNVYDLDINAYSYYADFYLWFRWKGDRDPMNIEFVNAVEKWGFTQVPFYEEPRKLEDGSSYNGMRIEGRFYHSFELSSFPLDRHALDIRVEHVDYALDSLIYIPDTATNLLRGDFIIPGWKIKGAQIETHRNFYGTNFGEPDVSGSSFSNFTFRLTIARPVSYFLLKLMLPLLLVILAALSALTIHTRYIDARISLPIGGLLSCIFLQQSYSAALPDVGYMVLMDRIYLLSYLLIAAVILRIVLGANRHAGANAADDLKIWRTDRRRALLFFLRYLAGSCLLGFTAR